MTAHDDARNQARAWHAAWVQRHHEGIALADAALADMLERIDAIPAAFDLGETRPDATNTGPRRSLLVDDSPGTLVLNVAGVVIEGVRFERYVDVRANDVRLVDCEVVGPADTANLRSTRGLIDCRPPDPSRPTVLEHVRAQPQTPNPYHVGVWGYGFHADRCDISHVVDGLGVHNSKAPATFRLTGSWVHDLAWFDNDPAHRDGSHSDGIQLHGLIGDIEVVGNSIEGWVSVGRGLDQRSDRHATSGFMANVPSLRSALFDGNWFDGGAALLNFAYLTDDTATVRVTDRNRYGAYRTVKIAKHRDLTLIA